MTENVLPAFHSRENHPMTATTSTLTQTDAPSAARRRSARAVAALGRALRRFRGAVASVVDSAQLGAPADVERSRLTGARA